MTSWFTFLEPVDCIFFVKKMLNYFHSSVLICTTYYEKSCPYSKHVKIVLKHHGVLRANKCVDRLRCVAFQSKELLRHFRGPIYQRLIHLQLLLLFGFSSNIFELAKSQFYVNFFYLQLRCTYVQIMSYYNLRNKFLQL